MTEIVGILLAAGASRRFGGPKLLHPLADGVPIGVAAARTLRQALPNSVAVVQPDDQVLITAFAAIGLKIVENPFADGGLGMSLAAGVRAVPEAAGWLIALADMPWVEPATIVMLAESLRNGASMVAPSYAGCRGHPVGFARRWGEQLGSLRGDKGARDLIADYAGELILHSTLDAGVLADIDHPGDLIRSS